MQVLYVAKKYIINSLVDECIGYLGEIVNPENVFCILSYGQQHDEKDLVDQCREVIDIETESVVKSEGFATIERSLLEDIIKRDSLTIREEELFKAVDHWATKECERQGLMVTGNLKREVLGEDIVKGIRFPTMEQKEFANAVIGSEILRSEEVIGIMKYFNSVTTVVGFPEGERVGALLSCCRFRGLAEGTRLINGKFKKEFIDVTVDKDIKLYGIRTFGSENREYVAMVNITDRQRSFSPVIASRSGTFACVSFRVKLESFNYYGFNILFDRPVALKKGGGYRITAIIDGLSFSYGTECYNSVKSHGVKFCFSNNDGSDCGQFAEFLFQQS